MGKKSLWLIFFASLLVRLIGSGQSFWLDEGISIVLAKLPLDDLFIALRENFHPPLFYLLLHLWLPVGGHSEWFIRLPFIIAGSLCVPVLYQLLLQLFGKEKRNISLAAALLLMFNPLSIYYSTELRMYSLNTLFSLLSWLYLTRWMKKINHKPSAICYLLFSLANIYTFYGALFNLVSQWVFVIWKYKNKLRAFVVCNLILGLLFLPWAPSLIKQLSGGDYFIRADNLSFKSFGLINKNAYSIFVAGVSLYFLLCSYLVSLTKEGRALLIWFYASIITVIIVSLGTSVLDYWHYIFLIPPFVSIIAFGLNQLPEKVYWLNLLAVFLIFLSGNIFFFSTPMFQREDWRTAAKVISIDRSLTIVNFPDVFAPLKFYAPNVYFYPNQESLGKTRPDLDQSLPLILSGRDTVFVFDYLSDLTDKKRSILSWLSRAGFNEQPPHNIIGVGLIYEFKAP